MKKFAVTWSKVYFAHGEEVVEADSRVDAEEMVENKIGDLTGSMQYNPDGNHVEAFEIIHYGLRNGSGNKLEN